MRALTVQQQITLAEGIRKCEPSAEEELVRLFSDPIAFLIAARTRDREAARDLTQEVMLAVVLALRNGQLRDAERLTAFVYGTARNVINNYRRARSRQPPEEPLDVEGHPGGMPNPFEDDGRRPLVRRAIEALPPADRSILLLTLVDGLKPHEIAGRLGLTPEVVRTRKSRALKKTIERVRKLSRR